MLVIVVDALFLAVVVAALRGIHVNSVRTSWKTTSAVTDLP